VIYNELMKIYVAHSIVFDFKNELYTPLKNSDLIKKNEFVFPHDGEISSSKEAIQFSDLILAEVSYPSTGEGIELGWADSFKKRIICVYKSGSKISPSLDYLKCEKIEYSDLKDLITRLRAAINSH
jgi:hypothetical protein